MGFFITFEGIEGSGKTTQIARLAQTLTQAGHRVIQTREPGGCKIADQLRKILLDPANSDLVPTAELLLYAAARAQHVAQVIQPALAEGAIVLCDRFTDATCAYQGAGRLLDPELINQLNQIATGSTGPELTILIDLPAQIGLQRAFDREAQQHDSSEGRFEREALAFHERVREAYLNFARRNPRRFCVVDGCRPISQLADTIWHQVKTALAQKSSHDL
jgi:dTMP kinase